MKKVVKLSVSQPELLAQLHAIGRSSEGGRHDTEWSAPPVALTTQSGANRMIAGLDWRWYDGHSTFTTVWVSVTQTHTICINNKNIARFYCR